VLGLQTRQIRRFRMTDSRHEMTRAARKRVPVSMLHDLWSRRMLLRKPIRWIGKIVDLCLRKSLRAARYGLGSCRLRWKVSILERECPRQISSRWLLGINTD